MTIDRATIFAGRKRSTRTRLMMMTAGAIASLTLSGCDWGSVSTNGTISILAGTLTPAGSATPAATATPTPTGSATPTATFTPVPIATKAAITNPVVVSEGDTLSIFWSGNHTGIFAADHSAIQFKGNAVANSDINALSSRLQADLALKPGVVTVFVGTYDLASAWIYPTTQDWLNALFAYTDKLRAGGAKVLVATILPRHIIGEAVSASFNPAFAARRIEANAGIAAALKAGRIDGVIDFAGDPVMGVESAADNPSLYNNGQTPTDGCGYNCGGQGRLASIYRDAVTKALGQ